MEVNENRLRELFNKADERIGLSKKEVLEIMKTPQQRADLIAKAIVNLVYETLSNIDKNTGKVKLTEELEKYLGKPGKGTSLTPGTSFKLDDEKFEITLDYSIESFGFIELWGNNKSFINADDKDYKYFDAEGNEIDVTYLMNKLKDYGLDFNYTHNLESTKKNTLIERQIVSITLPREYKNTNSRTR